MSNPQISLFIDYLKNDLGVRSGLDPPGLDVIQDALDNFRSLIKRTNQAANLDRLLDKGYPIGPLSASHCQVLPLLPP